MQQNLNHPIHTYDGNCHIIPHINWLPNTTVSLLSQHGGVRLREREKTPTRPITHF